MTMQSFGDASAPPTDLDSGLRLFFSEQFPLKWDDCSTSANFLSQYYAGVLGAKLGSTMLRDATHSIAYMVNELVENAVKFREPGPVEIVSGLRDGNFVLRITNLISGETSARFRELLADLTAGDPGQLLIERIEANAIGGNANGSGLGILTLMNDYSVRLTWNFQPGDGASSPVRIETIARLPLPTENHPTTSEHGN
jgi:hypothetical protein